MICDLCGKKKATVHLTEIVDEQLLEMHLCEECAREKSVQMEQQFGLSDLLAGLADFGKQVKDYEKVSLKCSQCGLAYKDFKKVGQLGCADCYSSFKKQLGPLLKRIHGSITHQGRSPFKVTKTVKQKIDLQSLRFQLQKAIESEAYEEAARLRDQIREFQEKESQENKGNE